MLLIHKSVYTSNFSSTGINQIVDIKALPKSGILMPKESHRILIRVKTYSASIMTDVLMTCSITDRNELYLYNKSIQMYAEEEKRLEGQFVITEKATIVPVSNIYILTRYFPVYS